MRRLLRPLAAALGAGALVGLVVGGAVGTTTGATATCSDPAVNYTATDAQLSPTCTVPLPPPATVTVTVTPSPTGTPTPTPTPSPTPSATASPPPPTGALYEAGSYLYSRPGAIDATKTAAMRTYLASVGQNYPGLNGLGSNAWGMVYAVGHSTDPSWHLTGTGRIDPRLSASGPGFKAPANLGMRITGTSDSPMAVDDEADGITVTAGKIAKAPLCTASDCTLTLTAGVGDYFTHGTNGLDTARPESDCGKLGKHCKASRGRIPDSMLVTAAEFAAAKANGTGVGHVLEMFWPETDSSAGFLLPMTGAEGGNVGWGAEGQRVAIDPSVNLSARPGCTPDALVIARTLQVNGAYIGDNAGGNSWVLKMEQNSPADPTSAGAFASLGQSELAGCITRSDFVATSN